MTFELHTPQTAPNGAKDRLQAVSDSLGGFLPNLYRQMANAPAVLDAYLDLSDTLRKTSFSPAEQQLILLTASVRNGCAYCVPAHTSAARMAKLDKDTITAIRDGKPIEDARLETLRSFTEELLETRGKLSDDSKQRFLDAGFTQQQSIEVLIGIAMKALSNSFARMVGTPVDDVLTKLTWDGNDQV
ncbi:carboxymuconolactone decarboxylase family protein [Sulfitobacter sp. F26204]|uniref:carboxymuconolactone decarboxylase family protein n=1 Tax=Sulfitobacter sp. F26204 TaxID=2996014 RepID=UPI00225E0461|nr:carboxymuconolactone decarboxylase family protein [Sulfitobacter sp. F26204]MCX7561447.1 carboxymuconolactone decarboxylase family protein [Sulfitobacter sp. F26204]